MLASHMELKGQTWPNVKMGEIGDVSTTFNYGLSDMMMNNLWVYDFNILQESQNDQISGFPEQVSSDFLVSGPALSSSLFMVDPQQNIENNYPNSIKITEMNQITKSKTTQKSIKGPRSKRFKRTIFQNPWNLTSTESVVHGSIDNQGSVMSKRKLKENDTIVPTFKKQKSSNLENNDLNSVSVGRCNGVVGVNSVGRWLEDVGFGRYAGVFEMHEVDEEALPLLTLDDLNEMGVLAVGTRRKLYAAICRLRGDLGIV